MTFFSFFLHFILFAISFEAHLLACTCPSLLYVLQPSTRGSQEFIFIFWIPFRLNFVTEVTIKETFTVARLDVPSGRSQSVSRANQRCANPDFLFLSQQTPSPLLLAEDADSSDLIRSDLIDLIDLIDLNDLI